MVVRRRSDLPPALLRGPFRVRDALALGVPPRRLDGSDLKAPTSGVRVPAHLPESLRLTCEAVALVLPETAAWSHLTALELCGIPLPGDALLQAPDRRPRVPEASVPAGVAPPRRQGVRGREGLDPASVCQ